MDLRVLLLNLFALFQRPQYVAAYKFLAVFPTPSRSNWIVHEPVLGALADRGHQIMVLSPYNMQLKSEWGGNVTQIHLNFLRNVSRPLDIEDFEQTWNPYDFVDAVAQSKVTLMDLILKSTEVQKLLRSMNKLDAIIVENLEYYALYALSRVYNVPLIGVTHLDHLDFSNLGSFVHPLFHSRSESIILQNGHRTVLQRIKAFYFEHFGKWFGKRRYMLMHNQLIQKYYGNNVPSAEELVDDFAVGIVNADPSLGCSRPVTPFTVQVGFLHINESEHLPQDLQNFLDKSTKGVIYINLGSNILLNKFDKHTLRMFQVMVEHINYDVIWRWEDCNLEIRPKNVKIINWAPQQAILAHPNVRVFITHGNILSMQEGVWYGVPMVAIPLFGEHLANAWRIQKLGIGVKLAFSTLTVEKLEDAITEVTTIER